MSHFYLLLGQFFLKPLLNSCHRRLIIKLPIIVNGTVAIKKSLSDQNFLFAIQTPGTLTGVIDRLERKNLVYRQVVESDRRSFLIVLTPEGEKMFARVFPVHIAYLKERFDHLDSSELELLRVLLARLRNAFESEKSF